MIGYRGGGVRLQWAGETTIHQPDLVLGSVDAQYVSDLFATSVPAHIITEQVIGPSGDAVALCGVLLTICHAEDARPPLCPDCREVDVRSRARLASIARHPAGQHRRRRPLARLVARLTRNDSRGGK